MKHPGLRTRDATAIGAIFLGSMRTLTCTCELFLRQMDSNSVMHWMPRMKQMIKHEFQRKLSEMAFQAGRNCDQFVISFVLCCIVYIILLYVYNIYIYVHNWWCLNKAGFQAVEAASSVTVYQAYRALQPRASQRDLCPGHWEWWKLARQDNFHSQSTLW